MTIFHAWLHASGLLEYKMLIQVLYFPIPNNQFSSCVVEMEPLSQWSVLNRCQNS